MLMPRAVESESSEVGSEYPYLKSSLVIRMQSQNLATCQVQGVGGDRSSHPRGRVSVEWEKEVNYT